MHALSFAEDCIENEKLLININLDHDEEHISAKQEIEALHYWWKERKVADDSNLFLSTGNKQYEKDNEMLIRLIKIRRYLWT